MKQILLLTISLLLYTSVNAQKVDVTDPSLPGIPGFSSVEVAISNAQVPTNAQIGSMVTVSGKVSNNGFLNTPQNFSWNVYVQKVNTNNGNGDSDDPDDEENETFVLDPQNLPEPTFQVSSGISSMGSGVEEDFTIQFTIDPNVFKKGKDNIVVIWPNLTDGTPEDNIIDGSIYVPHPNSERLAQPIASEFKAFPNPTKGQLTIQTKEAGDYDVSIMDLSGRVVLQSSFTESAMMEIDVTELNRGQYFLLVEGSDGYRKIEKLSILD